MNRRLMILVTVGALLISVFAYGALNRNPGADTCVTYPSASGARLPTATACTTPAGNYYWVNNYTGQPGE